MVRSPPLVFSLQQPISRRSVVAAKLATVFSFNLSFVALALGSATVMIAGLNMHVPASGLFVPSLVLAAIGGIASGFSLSVAASLSTWRRKIAGLVLLSIIPATTWIALIQIEMSMGRSFAFLLSLTPLTLAAALATSDWLVEAWNAQTSTPAKSNRRVSRTFRLPWMMETQAAVFDKEVKSSWRRRETVISLATLGMLAATIASIPYFMGEPPSGPLARLALPAIAMAGAYIGAALVLTSKGLSSIGGEFDSVWILRTAPIEGKSVAIGKVASYALIIPVVVATALPVSLLSGASLPVVAVLAFGALSISFLMISVGLYFGARSPSFDKNTGGLPDSFTMYAVFILGLMVCILFIAPTSYVFLADHVFGILLAILMADLSALLLVFVVRSAGRRFDALEI